MIPIGYMYKHVAKRSVWLSARQVVDIFSLSGCISEDFADYVNDWKHNGYWLFDSPAIIEDLAKEHSISLDGLKLFYYEAFENEYDEDEGLWAPFAPEASFTTNVQPPDLKTLEGFDVTTFQQSTTPEHSPLSCNALAATVPTNDHCLFTTFEGAKTSIEQGLFNHSEPGPFRIIAVFSVNGGGGADSRF